MRVTVTAKGPTLDTLTRDTIRDLRAANKKAGRQIARVGKRAMEKGAPVMWGRKLKVGSTTDAWPDRCIVELFPSPGNAGGWAIQESGRRGGYEIAPRNARALQFYGAEFYAAHALGGAWGGRKAWTAAGERLAKVLDRTIVDVYDDAMGA